MRSKRDAFPPLCCGACDFCRKDEEGFFCWARPPEMDATRHESRRATPVLAEWPICATLKPRINA